MNDQTPYRPQNDPSSDGPGERPTTQQPAAEQDVEHTQPLHTAPTQHRYRYETGPGPFGFAGEGPAPEAPARRRGGAVTAGVLVAALAVGTLGGIAGAAGFRALAPAEDAAVSTASPTTTSPVVTGADRAPAEGSVEEVANSVLPSVVKITVQGQQGEGSGSGVILSSDGVILTNNHVVEVAEGGGTLSVSFDDGSSAEAEVVGTDPLTDLAIIQAKDVSGLTPATLGSSDNLDVGEEVVAVGSPFGLEATVTTGIVSALARPVSAGDSTSTSTDTTYPAIQTDAAINPGNSGGPLVNMQGQVVGINSSIRTSSSMGEGGSIGLGFAIPLDQVLPIIDQLRNGETPTHARLGVTVTDASSRDGLLTGAGISSVSDGSAAADAGLEEGDVVTEVDGRLVSGSESLVATIRGYRPGDTVTLTVQRDGEERSVKATLDSDEGEPTS